MTQLQTSTSSQVPDLTEVETKVIKDLDFLLQRLNELRGKKGSPEAEKEPLLFSDIVPLLGMTVKALRDVVMFYAEPEEDEDDEGFEDDGQPSAQQAPPHRPPQRPNMPPNTVAISNSLAQRLVFTLRVLGFSSPTKTRPMNDQESMALQHHFLRQLFVELLGAVDPQNVSLAVAMLAHEFTDIPLIKELGLGDDFLSKMPPKEQLQKMAEAAMKQIQQSNQS